MDEIVLDLIQREIDGENAPEESERLNVLLRQDEAARTAFDELKMVATDLESLPLEAPPPSLRSRVMDELTREHEEQGSRLAALAADLRASLRRRPALSLGYAFVVGMLIGTGLFLMVQGGGATEDSLYGTLLSGSEMSDTAAYESDLALPGLTGKLRVHATSALVVVDMQVEASVATNVRIVPDQQLILRGLTRMSGHAAPAFEAVDGHVDLHVTGVDRYTVLFNRPPDWVPPVRLEVWRDGSRLHAENAQAGA